MGKTVKIRTNNYRIGEEGLSLRQEGQLPPLPPTSGIYDHPQLNEKERFSRNLMIVVLACFREDLTNTFIL